MILSSLFEYSVPRDDEKVVAVVAQRAGVLGEEEALCFEMPHSQQHVIMVVEA